MGIIPQADGRRDVDWLRGGFPERAISLVGSSALRRLAPRGDLLKGRRRLLKGRRNRARVETVATTNARPHGGGVGRVQSKIKRVHREVEARATGRSAGFYSPAEAQGEAYVVILFVKGRWRKTFEPA